MPELVTGEAVALDIRVARLASRACALFFDLLIMAVSLYVLIFVVMLTTVVVDDAWGAGLTILAVAGVVVGYPCAMESMSRGRTLGKMIMGLRVVADDGGPVRFRQALVRALAGVLEFWMFTGAPALLSSLFNRQGKRLGDLFAGTLVIQERIPQSALYGPVAVMPPQLAEWGRRLEVSMLSDELALTARQYLSRFWELMPEVRDELGERVAGEVMAVVSPPPPFRVRPEILLSAVLAERRRREEWRLAQRQAARMRRLGITWTPYPQPAPMMAMAGPPPARTGVPVAGPPTPPPFSAPEPGQPRFLPPSDYGAGPYQQVLTPGGPPPGWQTGHHPQQGPPQGWPTGQYPQQGPPQGWQTGQYPPQGAPQGWPTGQYPPQGPPAQGWQASQGRPGPRRDRPGPQQDRPGSQRSSDARDSSRDDEDDRDS